ncbi:MAG: hypothetical protein L6306_07770 [Planctomycetales bacterium]|nr:hypothetical protein [Planctomycetales bacterium]
MTDLEMIENQIASIQVEMDELQTAARVLRRLSKLGLACNQPNPILNQKRPRKKGKSSRPKIVDMARVVLQELGESHFSVVANEAIKRGYRGRANSTLDQIKKSYWSTMKRNPDIFITTGGGKFKLKAK